MRWPASPEKQPHRPKSQRVAVTGPECHEGAVGRSHALPLTECLLSWESLLIGVILALRSQLRWPSSLAVWPVMNRPAFGQWRAVFPI